MSNDRVPASRRSRMFRFHHRTAALAATFAASLTLGGCLTYTPQELSALPGDRLCEMQLYSRVNLSDRSKVLLQDELAKRNEDCRKYVAQLERERAQERERAMYELSGP